MSTAKEKLAAAKADLAKVEAQAHSVWLRWEPYLCALGGLVVGFLLGHFAHRGL